MLRYEIDISMPVALMDGVQKRAQDPGRIFKRWGGYFRAKALRRADAAEGWPPLAESTRKRYEQTRTSAVTTQGKIRKGYGAALESYLRSQVRKGNPTAASDLAELQRLRAGGSLGGAIGPHGGAVARLRARLARAEQQRAKGRRATAGGNRRKSKGHKLLGRVARSIAWQVQGSGVKAFGRVPFSAVHNDGGSAGHGAAEPQRSFLTIEEEDKLVLAEIVQDHLLPGS